MSHHDSQSISAMITAPIVQPTLSTLCDGGQITSKMEESTHHKHIDSASSSVSRRNKSLPSGLAHTLKREQYSAGSGSSFQCLHCYNLKFKSLIDYNKHKKQHTLLKSLLKPKQKHHKTSRSTLYRNKCKYCEKTFPKPSQCERHERIHTGIKPFRVRKTLYKNILCYNIMIIYIYIYIYTLTVRCLTKYSLV